MSRPAFRGALTLLVASVVLCACSGSETRSASHGRGSVPRDTSPSSVAPTPAPTTLGPGAGSADNGGASPRWLITGKALAMIAAEPGVQSVLDSSDTLVITGPESVIP